MATQLRHDDILHASAAPVRPRVTLVPGASPYDDLERIAPGVASRGIHPGVLKALVGCYAAMLASFWLFFARDTAAGLVLTVITVLMIMYFGLIVGGILLADSPAPGERQRSFADFLAGPVDISTGVISGREAMAQIVFLPAAMLLLATVGGVIAAHTR